MSMTDQHLLQDIGLTLKHSELRPVYAVGSERRRVLPGEERVLDMGTVGGDQNLEQAIIMRLLTPRGELDGLAHPEYGSRLHELIGRQNTPTVRNLVKLFILDSLQGERRIKEVSEVTVERAPGRRDGVSVLLRVEPVGAARTLTIGPFTLELER
jgi:phage baseplate assembly protein W